jgi:hypothetical protein
VSDKIRGVLQMNKRTVLKLFLAIGMTTVVGLTGCAPVTISSTPANATVYYKESGKRIGTTPLTLNLFANDKNLVVRKDGFFSQSVTLSTIDPESVSVSLRCRSNVLLVSSPCGADLYVGSRRVGKTPHFIDYGKPYRSFVVRAPGYITQTVEIPNDPSGNVVVKLERESNNSIIFALAKDESAGNVSIYDPLLNTPSSF